MSLYDWKTIWSIGFYTEKSGGNLHRFTDLPDKSGVPRKRFGSEFRLQAVRSLPVVGAA
jgi:hypothetical protein